MPGFGLRHVGMIRRVADVIRRPTSLHGDDALRRMLRDRLPAQTFEDLAVPFECVAASIERAQEHWFSSGDLIEPILASCALHPAPHSLCESQRERAVRRAVPRQTVKRSR
jgi:NTE family protein